MHPERQGHRFDRTKQRNLRNAGRVAPRLSRFDRDRMERPKDEERRPGQGFL
jgi:hypothetical protein